jgi:hypothetical protein
MNFIPGEYFSSIAEGDGVIRRYLSDEISSDSWAEEPSEIDAKDKDTPGEKENTGNSLIFTTYFTL